jgi:hypothetical protein
VRACRCAWVGESVRGWRAGSREATSPRISPRAPRRGGLHQAPSPGPSPIYVVGGGEYGLYRDGPRRWAGLGGGYRALRPHEVGWKAAGSRASDRPPGPPPATQDRGFPRPGRQARAVCVVGSGALLFFRNSIAVAPGATGEATTHVNKAVVLVLLVYTSRSWAMLSTAWSAVASLVHGRRCTS